MHPPQPRLIVQTTFFASLLVGSGFLFAVEASVQDDERFFESKVRPLLVSKCYECHSSDISEAGLRLDSHSFVLRGSDNGAVVTAGNIQKSKLITVIKASGDTSMPPDGKLAPEEIKILGRMGYARCALERNRFRRKSACSWK